MLVVEPSNNFLPSWVDGPQRGMMVPVSDYSTRNVGVFSLFGDTSTKFSDSCPNAIVQTSYIPKPDIQVLWTAPPKGSGCVVFRYVLSCLWSECGSDRHHNRLGDWVAGWATRVEFFTVPKSALGPTQAAIQSLLGVKQPGHEA
jgi:Reeler domain.